MAALAGGDPLPVVVDRLRSDPSVERVVVLSYMVADGILRDRMVQVCDDLGVPIADGTLGETQALARLLIRRADEAAGRAAAR